MSTKVPSPVLIIKPKRKTKKVIKTQNTTKSKTPSPIKNKNASYKLKTIKKKLNQLRLSKTIKNPVIKNKKLILTEMGTSATGTSATGTSATGTSATGTSATGTDLKTNVINITKTPSPFMNQSVRLNEIFMDILGELADIMQRQGEPFRARAYQQAQETIMTYDGNITNLNQLKGLKGIGKTIEGKLEEYIKTGTLKVLERERLNPLNILTRIYGIGPKKAKELIDKGITSIADLRKNTELLNETQQTGLKYFEAIETRIPRAEIDEYKQILETYFQKSTPPGSSFEIVGSYRRGVLTSGDIDIIITNKDNNTAAFTQFLNQLVKQNIIIELLTRGKTKSLTIAQLPGKTPRRVDFLYTSPEEYAFAILYFTGSKIFNTVQRQLAVNQGYTLNEHGIYHMSDKQKGNHVSGTFTNEKAIFDFLGMVYKEPSERIDGRAVQIAVQGTPLIKEPSPLIKEPSPLIKEPSPLIKEPSPLIKQKKTTLKVKKTNESSQSSDNLTTFKEKGQQALISFTEKELSDLIHLSNNAYYCNNEPIMTDNEYDILREYTLDNYPENKVALEGHTKCAIKLEKNKVKLPYEMWSMDKIKPTTDALLKWKQIYTGPYIISCKLDGVSALYTTENKEPKLYTRGNGLVGQDISHLIPYLHLPRTKNMVIRGEIIIKKMVFVKKYASSFANPRNFVAGVVNQKTTDDSKYQDLSFVAYEVIKPELKPSEQYNLLEKEVALTPGNLFQVVKYIKLEKHELTNEYLSKMLIKWRTEYEYEIDGIICIDNKLYPRTTGNPAYAFAFKMVLSDQIAEAKVVNVIWTPSKDGYLKPRVQIQPISLGGVTIEYATGFNARFIVDNNIGIGALIRLIRSGDVIPHITEVVQPATKPLMPTVPYEWNTTQVDIMLTNKDEDSTVKEKTISGFFANIEVEGLGPGNIKRMIEAGYDSVAKIIALSEADLLKVEGFKEKLALKIHTNIKQQIEKATLPELMHASNLFGRGFGTKKLELILAEYPTILIEKTNETDKIEKISNINGMAKKTAEQFVKEIPDFIAFITNAKLQSKLHLHLETHHKVETKSSLLDKNHQLYGKKWVMTGFRDKELMETLLSFGSEQGSAVNKKTSFVIVKDLEESNVKTADAQKLGIPIMTPDQVRDKFKL
jgi:DNA ligase (NAD+)